MDHRERWEVKEKWVPWETLAIKENLVILGLKVSMVFPAKRVREVRFDLYYYVLVTFSEPYKRSMLQFGFWLLCFVCL